MKACTKCKTEKPLDEFYVDRRRKDGRQPWCKACHNAWRAANRAANPERLKENSRRYYLANKDRQKANGRAAHLLRKYRLTVQEYDAMLSKQGGVCAICKQPPSDRRFPVDHCHSSGEVRGILCDRCNRLIGQAGDDPEILLNAVAYLKP